MKEFIKYCLKAYLGGCLGCFGAISLVFVVLLFLGLLFGAQFTSIIQSIPGLVSQGLSSIGRESDVGNNPAQVQPMEVYLTLGNDPESKHITSFMTSQYDQIHFWVSTRQEETVNFTLLITFPDGTQHQFGPTFKTLGAKKPVPCGQFGQETPPIGEYKLEVMPSGSSSAVGSIVFNITK